MAVIEKTFLLLPWMAAPLSKLQTLCKYGGETMEPVAQAPVSARLPFHEGRTDDGRH
jgi:hypothetical protein